MQRILTSLLLIIISHSVYGQTHNRVEVKGLITSDNNDVENVTVYNTSSNNGTITNSEGEFTLKVGLNDVIEVSALQFKAVTVKVTKDVLENQKQLSNFLKQLINQINIALQSNLKLKNWIVKNKIKGFPSISEEEMWNNEYGKLKPEP